MPEAEVPACPGASAVGEGRLRKRDVASNQAHRRVEPETNANANLELAPRHRLALREDVAGIREHHAIRPAVDREARFLVDNQQAITSARHVIVSGIAWAQAVFAVAANAGRAAGAESIGKLQGIIAERISG